MSLTTVPVLIFLISYISRLSLGHLSPKSSAEGGKRDCLAVNLLFRSHFLINVADKVVAMHSIQR